MCHIKIPPQKIQFLNRGVIFKIRAVFHPRSSIIGLIYFVEVSFITSVPGQSRSVFGSNGPSQ
jgi:hypothetical protein